MTESQTKDLPAEKLSDEALEVKLEMVERMLSRCVDKHAQAALNQCYQRLINERARRDLLK